MKITELDVLIDLHVVCVDSYSCTLNFIYSELLSLDKIEKGFSLFRHLSPDSLLNLSHSYGEKTKTKQNEKHNLSFSPKVFLDLLS